MKLNRTGGIWVQNKCVAFDTRPQKHRLTLLRVPVLHQAVDRTIGVVDQVLALLSAYKTGVYKNQS